MSDFWDPYFFLGYVCVADVSLFLDARTLALTWSIVGFYCPRLQHLDETGELCTGSIDDGKLDSSDENEVLPGFVTQIGNSVGLTRPVAVVLSLSRRFQTLWSHYNIPKVINHSRKIHQPCSHSCLSLKSTFVSLYLL